jgi:hypothetical protein
MPDTMPGVHDDHLLTGAGITAWVHGAPADPRYGGGNDAGHPAHLPSMPVAVDWILASFQRWLAARILNSLREGYTTVKQIAQLPDAAFHDVPSTSGARSLKFVPP